MTMFVYNLSLTLETARVMPIGENATDATIQRGDDEVFEGVHSNCTNCTCTPLSRLDLRDVFTRMDIGNTEFWDSISVSWLACFITYYILFSILLVILFIYFLKRFRRGFFVTIQILFIMWCCFSCIHYTLIMNSILNGASIQLANTSRALELIASSSFMNFAVLAILLNLDSPFSQKHPRRRLYIMFISIPIYLITGVITVVSLLAGSAAIASLIVFRLLIFISSIVLVNLDIDYKHCLKVKEQFRLLWTQKKLLIYPYFLMSLAYFTYLLITVASNSKCVEDIQLHRVIWLVFNCLLRIYEVGFFLVYFLTIGRMVKVSRKGKPSLRNWMKFHFTVQKVHKATPLKSLSFIYHQPTAEDGFNNFSSKVIAHDQPTDLKMEEEVTPTSMCESEEQRVQVAAANPIRGGMIETEPLFQSSSSYYSERSLNLEAQNKKWPSNSTVTCSLSTNVSQSVKSIAFSDESVYLNNDGKVVCKGIAT